MPGYGLPAADKGKGLLPWEWAVERLTESHNYWVATTRPEGRPHVMPVWGIWVESVFYFSTGRESRKSKNLVANPRCVICTEKAEEAVVLEGSAEEVTDAAVLKRLGGPYHKKYKPLEAGSEPGAGLCRPAGGGVRAGREKGPDECNPVGFRRVGVNPKPLVSDDWHEFKGRTDGSGKGSPHSYLRLSTGSSWAARVAGRVPKIIPTRDETTIAIIADSPEMGMRYSVRNRTENGIASPITIPMTPPIREIKMASDKN